MHRTIKLTMELEQNGSLPFLDTNLKRKEEGSLNITVFRKQTHTDTYTSSHAIQRVPREEQCGALYDRARNQKDDHLLAVFKMNGYLPASFIRFVATHTPSPTHPIEDRVTKRRTGETTIFNHPIRGHGWCQ